MYFIHLRHNQPLSEIEKYVDKMTAVEDRFDLFVELESWRKALEVCVCACVRVCVCVCARVHAHYIILFCQNFCSFFLFLLFPGGAAVEGSSAHAGNCQVS